MSNSNCCFLTSYFCIPVPCNEKNIFFGCLGLHRTVQLLQHYWSGHRLGLSWYWMVCLGDEQRSFCHFWDCIQVLHFGLCISTTGYCFCFGSIPSFFLELFLHWCPVAYWAPTDLGSSSFSILSICLFILFMGFSRQEYRSGLPFPSPVDHILSDLSTMTRPSWVAPQAWLSSLS